MKKTIFNKIAIPLVALVTIALPPSSTAMMTAYLKIGDIAGESQRVDHEDEIDIHGFYWESYSGSTNGVTGRARISCEIKDLEVLKFIDAASAPLIMSQLEGKVFDKAVLSVRKDSGEAHLDYLVITLYSVTVNAIKAVGGTDTEGKITERVSLGFQRGMYRYTRQEDDHSAGDITEISFNNC